MEAAPRRRVRRARARRRGALRRGRARGRRAAGRLPRRPGARRAAVAHLASRLAVEEALLAAAPEAVALRASIVVGARSRSFRFLVRLVERVPVMPLPAWRDHRTQPIDVRDVIAYLVARRDARRGRRPAVARRRRPGRPDLRRARSSASADALLVARPRGAAAASSLTPVASAVAAAIAGEDRALILPLMEGLDARPAAARRPRGRVCPACAGTRSARRSSTRCAAGRPSRSCAPARTGDPPRRPRAPARAGRVRGHEDPRRGARGVRRAARRPGRRPRRAGPGEVLVRLRRLRRLPHRPVHGLRASTRRATRRPCSATRAPASSRRVGEGVTSLARGRPRRDPVLAPVPRVRALPRPADEPLPRHPRAAEPGLPARRHDARCRAAASRSATSWAPRRSPRRRSCRRSRWPRSRPRPRSTAPACSPAASRPASARRCTPRKVDAGLDLRRLRRRDGRPRRGRRLPPAGRRADHLRRPLRGPPGRSPAARAPPTRWVADGDVVERVLDETRGFGADFTFEATGLVSGHAPGGGGRAHGLGPVHGRRRRRQGRDARRRPAPAHHRPAGVRLLLRRGQGPRPGARSWCSAISTGDIDVDAFLSHPLTLDEVNRGFDLMHQQDGIRSVISFT